MLFFWTFYLSRIPEKYESWLPKRYQAAYLFSSLIININEDIRMISEGSCEDWSNDAENSALITGINYSLIRNQMENNYFKL